MNRKLTLAAIASVFMMAGCLGGYEAPTPGDPGSPGTPGTPGTPGDPTNQPPTGGNTTPPAPSTAQPKFQADVAPIVMAQCSASGCHGGTGTNPIKFAAGTDLYASVLSFSDKLLGGNFDKNTAQMIAKVAPGNHYTAKYVATDITKIGDWLDAEKSARANGGTPATSARVLLLQKWSGCMDKGDFDTEQVANAWANKQTNEGACQQCHPTGQGFLARNDSTFVFDVLTTQPNPKGGYFMEYYFTVDTTTDPANPKIIINKDLILRAATGTAQHPKFTLDNDGNGNNPTAFQRLTNFYTKTMARMTAGTCGAPKLQ